MPFAIRPWPAGPERFPVRRSLPAQPVSAVGLTTRQRRGAGGGHQAVYAFDLEELETGEAAAAQQNGEQQEAEREDRETASRREKAQAKGESRCVSTGFPRPAGPPAVLTVPHTDTGISARYKKAPSGAVIVSLLAYLCFRSHDRWRSLNPIITMPVPIASKP